MNPFDVLRAFLAFEIAWREQLLDVLEMLP